MRLVFMGTPQIAAQCLEVLLQDERHEVCAVYTRMDKPVGRKQIMTPPPTKQLAQQYGVTVYQPRNLRDEAVLDELCAHQADLLVVVAYGCILPPRALQAAKLGAINLHVSLLPKYRGAAPVQWSIINGERETGVTIMQMNEGLDTGDILYTVKTPIGENETSGELFERVSELGSAALVHTLAEIEKDTVQRIPQNHTLATQAPVLTKQAAAFDFDQTAASLHNLVRGMNPWPIAFFMYEGKKIKVKRTLVAKGGAGVPGEILCLSPLTVACGEGALVLLEVVPEGARTMQGQAWAQGRRFLKGDLLK